MGRAGRKRIGVQGAGSKCRAVTWTTELSIGPRFIARILFAPSRVPSKIEMEPSPPPTINKSPISPLIAIRVSTPFEHAGVVECLQQRSSSSGTLHQSHSNHIEITQQSHDNHT